jgi:hypothetical protein
MIDSNYFVGLFICVWLTLTLVNIIYNTVLECIKGIKGTVAKAFYTVSDTLSILAGLSLAILMGAAFAGDNAVLYIVNGTSFRTIIFSIAIILIFACLGGGGASYGSRFFSQALVFGAKKCFNRKFREENKLTGTQKVMLTASITGIIFMLMFYMAFVDFELTFVRLLLWCYIPIFGACSGLGLAVPVIRIVKDFRENRKTENE